MRNDKERMVRRLAKCPSTKMMEGFTLAAQGGGCVQCANCSSCVRGKCAKSQPNAVPTDPPQHFRLPFRHGWF